MVISDVAGFSVSSRPLHSGRSTDGRNPRTRSENQR
jgi:hypothetical protein